MLTHNAKSAEIYVSRNEKCEWLHELTTTYEKLEVELNVVIAEFILVHMCLCS